MKHDSTFGAVILTKESSIARYPALWLMIKNGPHSAYKGAAHLNVEQAIEIRETLDQFIKENS